MVDFIGRNCLYCLTQNSGDIKKPNPSEVGRYNRTLAAKLRLNFTFPFLPALIH